MGNDNNQTFAAGEVVEDFDREYQLNELIPTAYFDSLFADLKSFGVTCMQVFLNDMSLYYSSGTSGPDVSDVKTAMTSAKNEEGTQVKCMGSHNTLVPVVHEFDEIGYLVFSFDLNAEPSGLRVVTMSHFVGKVIDQLVACTHKHLMTSGIHTQVVRDSYEEIKQKTELLEKSEKKYRLLAESLEEEVEKKAQEIKAAQTQLMHQDKLASIGQLAAGVAHEINNPMGFVSSNLQTLKEYVSDLSTLVEKFQAYIKVAGEMKSDDHGLISEGLDELRTFADSIDLEYILEDMPSLLSESMDGADRINKIVSDLKDFAHPGEESPCFADVNSCIESTMNIVWNELKYKATVTKSFGKISQIFCYPRQLNQVLMNLLVNAANAIENKGNIDLLTRETDGFVELLVTDTGCGIPEENLSRIFDPFFTTKEVGKGTGLGLNLVYNIVKKHNGTIDVESVVGKGTTFIVRLPINP